MATITISVKEYNNLMVQVKKIPKVAKQTINLMEENEKLKKDLEHAKQAIISLAKEETAKEFKKQMERLHDDEDSLDTMWPQGTWCKADYKELFYYIEKGYLVQGDAYDNNNGFVINEQWDWRGDEDEDWEYI